jgi:sarcosine oxidase subunit gamma
VADVLAPRSAFAGLARAVGEGAGVVVTDRDGIGFATVLARKGRAAVLAGRVRERFGIDLPTGPKRVASGAIAFAGTGPDAWLATAERGDGFAATLREALNDLAAVSDQSGGTAALRLAGPRVRDALAKGVTIDVHPRSFAVGDVAVTAAAHIGVTLWRLDDDADGAVFEVAIARSFAGSFWHWLSASAAEFGLVVR